MNIKSTELYNTGGGCMVLFMDIEHLFQVEPDCQLVQIGYSGECYVGFNKRYQEAEEGIQPQDELWAAYNYEDLIKHVGIDLAIDLYNKVTTSWKWSDDVENLEAIESVINLIDFTTAASKLSDNWHDNVTAGYPFNDSFEQIMLDIFNWQQIVLNKLRK
jgi:hypothetical protein